MFDGWDLVAEPPPIERDFRAIVVAGRRFAVPADAVRGELGPTRPTPVPGAARVVRGVLMWQGQVVPVVSTSIRLSLPVLGEDDAERPLIQIEVGGETFFLEVDAPGETIVGQRLEPVARVPMVAGFVELDGERVPVLDLDAFTDFLASEAPGEAARTGAGGEPT